MFATTALPTSFILNLVLELFIWVDGQQDTHEPEEPLGQKGGGATTAIGTNRIVVD